MVKRVNRRYVIVLLLVMVLGIMSLWQTAREVDKSMRLALLGQARIAATTMDTAHLSRLSGSGDDLSLPYYLHLKDQLAGMLQSIDGCSSLYLIGRKADGQLFVLVDSLPVDSKKYAAPGTVFSENTDYYLSVFKAKKTNVIGPVPYQGNKFIKALVPVFLPDIQNPAAVLGVDIDAGVWKEQISNKMIVPFIAIIILTACILILVFRLNKVTSLQDDEEGRGFLSDISFEGIVIQDKGTILDANLTFAKMFGYKLDEIIGTDVIALAAPECHDLVKNNMRSGYEGVYETTGLRKDGSTFPAIIRGKAIQYKGKIVRMAAARDIIGQKKAEKKLKESRELFRKFSSLTFEGIVIHKDGVINDMNESFIEITEYSRDELLGENIISLCIPEEYQATVKENFSKDGSEPYDIMGRKKDGTLFPMELHGRNVTIDNEQFRVTAVRDISSHKKTEENLKNIEELFRWITGYTSALVSIHDSEGNYIYASPSHKRLGYDSEDLIGQSGFAMVVEEDIVSLLEELEKARQGEMDMAFLNYRLKDKDGKIHYYRGAFDGVFLPDGSLEKIICVGEDITEQKEAEREKLEAQKAAAEHEKYSLVGQIAGKMAHDFNNVLGAVMGNTELALLDCRDEAIRSTLTLILNQSRRGKNLTKNLMAFAKDNEPKQEYFSVNEKIELVLDLLKKDIQMIEVARDLSPQLPNLLADPGMIEHCLVNLLQNSTHAVSKSDSPTITIKTYQHDKYINIEIQDNGCGIPDEFIDKIFEPSFTLKGGRDATGSYKSGIKGTGYGMANIKKCVEQHHGTIAIDSDVQKGTTVTLGFPGLKETEAQEHGPVIDQDKLCIQKNILLVEDEQAISGVQFRLLTRGPCNHRVDIAPSAEAAMNFFDNNEYDFVSLDYVLEGEANGMDVYGHIREKNKTIPILFISGNLEFLESIAELKHVDNYIDHVSKPCANEDYINAINSLMERSK